jgi:hypothetical protein
MVVAKPLFGARLDLGVSFPPLLEIIVVAGLTPEQYRAGNCRPDGRPPSIASIASAGVGTSHRSELPQVAFWPIY